jgi:hypothetical protein
VTLSFDMRPATPDADARHRSRWTFAGVGVVNVWRFGTLEVPAPSGRILLRGANGTGKTTAMELLVPLLLDLDNRSLQAGKARSSSWSQMMKDGAPGGGSRVGFAWLTFGDADGVLHSYGTRVSWRDNGAPAALTPFRIVGRPLHELDLFGPQRSTLPPDDFAAAIRECGGETFSADRPYDDYVHHLATTVFNTDVAALRAACARIRDVRNPTVLTAITPLAARAALAESLPKVEEATIQATAAALQSTAETAAFFERDADAAEALATFSGVWAGHARTVLTERLDALRATEASLGTLVAARDAARHEDAQARAQAEELGREQARCDEAATSLEGDMAAYRTSEAFQAAGALDELGKMVEAMAELATTAHNHLLSTASYAARDSRSIEDRLSGLAQDVDELAGRVAVAAARHPVPELRFHQRQRSPLTVGDATVPAGAVFTVSTSPGQWQAIRTQWTDTATQHARRADAARTHSATYPSCVAGPAEQAERAKRAADAAVERAAEAREGLLLAQSRATAEGAAVCQAWQSWLQAHREHVGTGEPTHDEIVTGLGGAELAEVLDVLSRVHDQVGTSVSNLAAGRYLDAQGAHARAGEVRAQAGQASTEAAALRAGRLAPQPRPAWAEVSEQAATFGAAVDWVPGADEQVRDRVELALAHSGILGAELNTVGAVLTGTLPGPGPDVGVQSWVLSAGQTVSGTNLADVLTADPEHPLAHVVTACLTRIALTSTTTAAGPTVAGLDTAAFVVGRDGSFRVGPLTAGAPARVPRASHVGARARQRAAKVRAEELVALAAQLIVQAEGEEAAAVTLTTKARQLEQAARTRPSLERARQAEATRAQASSAVTHQAERADYAQQAFGAAQARARESDAEWTAGVRRDGLVANLDELDAVERTARAAAGDLRAAVAQLGTYTDRLQSAVAALAGQAETTEQLETLAGAAVSRHEDVTRAEAKLATLEEVSGQAAKDVHDKLRAAELKHRTAKEKLGRVRSDLQQSAVRCGSATANRAAAEQACVEAAPTVLAARSALRAAVEVPGVAATLTPGVELSDAVADDRLVAVVTEALGTLPRRQAVAVRTTYDSVRTTLSALGTWSLEVADVVAGIDTYVLSHRDELYTPPAAAAKAAVVRAQAQEQMSRVQQQALEKFIAGQLPSAIGRAWASLQQWVRAINRKMADAASSSGVSVQVKVSRADDLTVAQRTVFDLACGSSPAQHTEQERDALAEALQMLLSSAEGDSAVERVRDAVNIAAWVSVDYMLRRGDDAKVTRWTQNSGLSGGERRLVVLAPMLASIAAMFDSFGSGSLRIVTLDEVPAEVDEQGRGALARYLAALDLDLMCTSYGWDGAPGEWDGIDIAELERSDIDDLVIAEHVAIRSIGSTVPVGLQGPARGPGAGPDVLELV